MRREKNAMKTKLLVAAALLAGLAGAMPAFAQDSTTTSSTGTDYLRAENIQDFYTDPNLKTMKSEEEVKKVYATMPAENQAKLKSACAANQESKFADFCKTIDAM